MAGIYDVNAAIDKPNFLGSFRQGQMYGQQMKQNALAMQQAQQDANDRNALRQLAPQIISGDPVAYQQAAAINPQAAGQYQGAGDGQMRRLKGAIDFMDQAKKTGNQQAVEAAWQQVRPYLNRMSPEGVEPPMTFAEAEPKMEEARARIAMAMAGQVGEMPTGFRQFQMTAEAAGLVPGTPEYQQAANIALGREGRASSAGFGFELVEGADGRKRLQRRNPRTGAVETYDEGSGNFVPVGGASMAQAPTGMTQVPSAQFATVNGVPIPPEEVAAYQRALEADQRGEEFNIQIPPGGAPVVRTGADPSLVVGRRPEDEAAAVEAAKTQVQLGALPQQLAIQTQDAVTRAGGVAAAQETAKTGAELAQKDLKRTRDADETLRLLDEAERLLPNATGGGLAALRDRGAAFFGKSTEGAQNTAALNLLSAKLVANVPRFEGPQSNIDVQFYREAAGDLANPTLPVDTRLAAARTMRSLQQKYATQTPRESPGQAGGQVRRARNPQTGEVLVLRNGAWVAE